MSMQTAPRSLGFHFRDQARGWHSQISSCAAVCVIAAEKSVLLTGRALIAERESGAQLDRVEGIFREICWHRKELDGPNGTGHAA